MNDYIYYLSPIIAIIAIGLTIYFYLKGRKIKKLKYEVTNSIILYQRASGIENIKIMYEGVSIKNAGLAKITIANAGNTIIEKDDVDENDVLRILIDKKSKILEYNIITSNNQSVNITKENDYTLLVNFNFLNPKDSFDVQLIHDGTIAESIVLRGKVKGINEFDIISRITIDASHKFILSYFNITGIYEILFLIVFSIIIITERVDLLDKYSAVFSVFLVLFIITSIFSSLFIVIISSSVYKLFMYSKAIFGKRE